MSSAPIAVPALVVTAQNDNLTHLATFPKKVARLEDLTPEEIIRLNKIKILTLQQILNISNVDFEQRNEMTNKAFIHLETDAKNRKFYFDMPNIISFYIKNNDNLGTALEILDEEERAHEGCCVIS